MKLIGADVRWNIGWANHPELILIVDEMLNPNEQIYSSTELPNGSTLYHSQHESGMVSFFCHDRRHERGYGGHSFALTMEDGSIISIKGPWSSRAGAMNNHFPHCVDVILREACVNGNYSGAVSLELANRAAEMADVTLGKAIKQRDMMDDICYEIQQPKPVAP